MVGAPICAAGAAPHAVTIATRAATRVPFTRLQAMC
jgi:hypothetical protein